MNKILLAALIFVFLIVFYIINTYYLAPEAARKNGGEFVKVCDNLQGKSFTLENIAKVDGFVDLNGHDRVTEERIKEYIGKDPNEYSLSIYKDSWFKGPSIKYSWICRIKFNKDNFSIISSSEFYVTD